MVSLGHPKSASGGSAVTGPTNFSDDEFLRFGDDDDFGLKYDSGSDQFQITDNTATAPNDLLGVNKKSSDSTFRVKRGSLEVSPSGGNLASSGAIRLANDAEIRWRNSAGNDDHVITWNSNDNFLVQLDTFNEFAVVPSANAVRVFGNRIDQIGGATDADSGDIRLANASEINWRSSEDDNDHGWRLSTTENMTYQAAGTDRAEFTESGNLNIEGTLSESVTL